jgi:hypothetical protein
LLFTYSERKQPGTARSGEEAGWTSQKHLTVFEICKLACPLSGTLILTVVIYNDVWSNCSKSTDSHPISPQMFAGRLISRFARSPVIAVSDYLLRFYVESKVLETLLPIW